MEIMKLDNMLNRAEINYEFNNCFDGYSITVNQIPDFSAVQHSGAGKQLIEIFGLLTEEESKNGEVTVVNAIDIFNRIMKKLGR